MKPSAQQLIAKLGLAPHQEGGWFRETYRSGTQVQTSQGRRGAVTAIYYLLEHGRPCPWHVVQSDEIWHYYYGAPAELLSYDPLARTLRRQRLELATGEGVQVAVIPAGCWQAAHCLGDYTLAGCTVSPGYEAQDFRWVRDVPGYPAHFSGALQGLEAFLQVGVSSATVRATQHRSNAMSKGMDRKKEEKKKPAKTLEEKRAAKRAKREGRG